MGGTAEFGWGLYGPRGTGTHPWQEIVHNDHVPLSAQIKVV